MKKLSTFALILLAMIFLNTQALSQQSYIRFGTGYNFAFSSQSLLMNYNVYDGYGTSEVVFASLGKGANFDVAFGHMFSKYVGLDLAFSYLLGLKIKSESNYNGSYYYGSGYDKTSINSRMFRIIPALVITPGLTKINPYARIGIVIGIGSVLTDNDYMFDGENYVEKYKYSGGIAFGLSSALGIQFELGKSALFFTELCMVNMSYAPTKGEVILAEENGVDILSTYTTRERETVFVNEITYYDDSNPSDNEPAENLKQKLPFGSFGINVGVIILIGK